MNVHPRPAQVTERRDYSAELHYTDLLGGDRVTIGPFTNPRERDRAIAAARATLPGDHWPSARLWDTPR